jgi:transcriptional regulator with XRE-family HTH domain
MPNDLMIIHGHLLKEAREDLNLSIEEVARHLTLSDRHIISMEENKKVGFVSTQLKLISVRKYANFLELDIDSVIENTKNKTKSLNLPEPNIDETKASFIHKNLFVAKIKVFLLWAKIHIRIPHIFYFIIFLFASNFLIGVYQKYAVAQKNFEGKSLDLPNLDQLPNDIATYEINPTAEKIEKHEALPVEIKKVEENKKDNKDPVIKMCGQAISKPIAQISSSIDPLKPSDYFHIISRSHQTICILDSKGKEDKYALTEGQKLTYRGGQPPFKLVIDPVVTDIFYEGWLVKLKPEQNYIQLNPKTYN